MGIFVRLSYYNCQYSFVSNSVNTLSCQGDSLVEPVFLPTFYAPAVTPIRRLLYHLSALFLSAIRAPGSAELDLSGL